MFEGEIIDKIQYAINESKDIQKKAQRKNSFQGSEVSVSITSGDHFALALNMLFVNMKGMDILLVIFCLFALIFWGSGLPVYALVFLGMAVFCILYMLFLSYAKSAAHVAGSKAGFGFSQYGLFVKDKSGYMCVDWKNLRARNARRHIFFYYSTFGALIIPKRDLSGAQLETINSFINNFELEKKTSKRKN